MVLFNTTNTFIMAILPIADFPRLLVLISINQALALYLVMY